MRPKRALSVYRMQDAGTWGGKGGKLKGKKKPEYVGLISTSETADSSKKS